MRIGIDLDDTITALPVWFSVVTDALVAAGHEVHVITYRQPGTEVDVARELAEHRIRYSSLHLPSTGVDPPTWKSAVAGELGLDLMIEDSPEVLSRMPERTARMWICDPEVFDLDVCIRALREHPG